MRDEDIILKFVLVLKAFFFKKTLSSCRYQPFTSLSFSQSIIISIKFCFCSYLPAAKPMALRYKNIQNCSLTKFWNLSFKYQVLQYFRWNENSKVICKKCFIMVQKKLFSENFNFCNWPNFSKNVFKNKYLPY